MSSAPDACRYKDGRVEARLRAGGRVDAPLPTRPMRKPEVEIEELELLSEDDEPLIVRTMEPLPEDDEPLEPKPMK